MDHAEVVKLGVDVSNWTGPVADWQARAMAELGYTFAIVGTQMGVDGRRYTVEQVQGFRAGGVAVKDAYVPLQWDDVRDRVAEAAALVGPLGIKTLWLDCEAPPDGRSPADLIALMHQAVAVVPPCLDVGIYTGRWWWVPNTWDTPDFRRLPLWHAEYPRNRLPPDFRTFKPYGGWTRPVVWQYTDNHPLAGLNVDLDARGYWYRC